MAPKKGPKKAGKKAKVNQPHSSQRVSRQEAYEAEADVDAMKEGEGDEGKANEEEGNSLNTLVNHHQPSMPTSYSCLLFKSTTQPLFPRVSVTTPSSPFSRFFFF